jgi:hypothetical protein
MDTIMSMRLIGGQATPDDAQADLRIWAPLDDVFEGVMHRLGLAVDPIPVWRPRDALPLTELPQWLEYYYREKATNLEEMAEQREREREQREREQLAVAVASDESAVPR